MSTDANSSTGGSKRKLAPFAASLLGTTIDGRFRVEKAIGQGAMGTVFAATQLSVNRRVAIKVLREQISDTSKARFMREAQVISAISHPNIVQLIDFGERAEDELLYLVMEYVDGLRMSRLVKKGRVHPNLAIEIVSQICSALAEAHAKGIVHRDLKPSNMLLVRTADGSLQVKVLDFGVAHTYEDAAELTATGVLCGTPAYMAPEQARGKEVTPRVDLYALGVNLYEMLGGFRPFRGSTPVEVAMQQIQQPPPSLQGWVDEELMPPALVDVANSLLQKDPDARPQSASELRQIVLHVRSHYGWGPVLFPNSSDDVWKNWTQPKLASHGGTPIEGEPQRNRSWSGSWTGRATGAGFASSGSQGAMHDASGVAFPSQSTGPGSDSLLRPATPREVPGGERSHADVPERSIDSLPSRHGGGWDAFRGEEPARLDQADVVQPGKHAVAVAHVGTATPSEETAHIVRVAEGAARQQPERAERVPAPPSAPGAKSAPEPEPAPGPQADREIELPIQPSRPGGSSPQPELKSESFVEATSASYEGLWTQSGRSDGNLPTIQDAENLEVERRHDSGTLVSDYEAKDRASFADMVRFGMVVVLAFLVCAAVGYALLYFSGNGGSADPVVAPVTDLEEPETAPEPDESVPEEKTRKKKRRGKKSLKEKKWKEPIDLFDDPPPDDDPERKIVIEEAEAE